MGHYRYHNWEQKASFNLKICRPIKLRRRKTQAAAMCKGRRLTWLSAPGCPDGTWQAGQGLEKV